MPSHQRSHLSSLIAGLRATLPCLTEFVNESRPARIARFRANNAGIYDGAQVRALGSIRSITKAIRPKKAPHTRGQSHSQVSVIAADSGRGEYNFAR
jgi:hypothetical protein